jgi:hypothetical protein
MAPWEIGEDNYTSKLFLSSLKDDFIYVKIYNYKTGSTEMNFHLNMVVEPGWQGVRLAECEAWFITYKSVNWRVTQSFWASVSSSAKWDW